MTEPLTTKKDYTLLILGSQVLIIGCILARIGFFYLTSRGGDEMTVLIGEFLGVPICTYLILLWVTSRSDKEGKYRKKLKTGCIVFGVLLLVWSVVTSYMLFFAYAMGSSGFR